MSLKDYSNILQDVLTACKRQCINANIGKIQLDIKRGIDKDFIINNLDCYI
jgi:hypothetical protein